MKTVQRTKQTLGPFQDHQILQKVIGFEKLPTSNKKIKILSQNNPRNIVKSNEIDRILENTIEMHGKTFSMLF